MPENASQFRERTKDCRNIAKASRNEVDRQMLDELADELDEEARKIDAERNAEST